MAGAQRMRGIMVDRIREGDGVNRPWRTLESTVRTLSLN